MLKQSFSPALGHDYDLEEWDMYIEESHISVTLPLNKSLLMLAAPPHRPRRCSHTTSLQVLLLSAALLLLLLSAGDPSALISYCVTLMKEHEALRSKDTHRAFKAPSHNTALLLPVFFFLFLLHCIPFRCWSCAGLFIYAHRTSASHFKDAVD